MHKTLKLYISNNIIELWIFSLAKFISHKFVEPVDFSRSEDNKTDSNATPDNSNRLNESERAFSLYSSMGVKSLKAQSSIQMLRSLSSDDLMKSSDDGSDDDESDVDIIGETKGYIS